MALIPSSSKNLSEFDILKASHKFLRDGDGESNSSSWNEQLARKYYDSLFREFAVCDLKHYKSGNFSLRWRTESEVLSGAGETTCGNTRCEHHHPPTPPLSTLELPFAYEEHGEQKSALVKIVLCQRCVKKLLWKRRKEKEAIEGGPEGAVESRSHKKPDDSLELVGSEGATRTSSIQRSHVSQDMKHRDRRRSSRSLSPRSRRESNGIKRK